MLYAEFQDFQLFHLYNFFSEKPLEEFFDTSKFRKEMYKKLVGFCFKDKQKGFEKTYDTFPVSNNIIKTYNYNIIILIKLKNHFTNCFPIKNV